MSTNVQSVTVIGPGAIGGMIAAWLCQNPNLSISLAARTGFDSLKLQTPTRHLNAAPQIFTDPAMATPADWILVATKAYDSARAAQWFPHLVGKSSQVAVLQNGVDHVDRFSAWMERDRILPVIVDCPVERTRPGVIVQRGSVHLSIPAKDQSAPFKHLFEDTEVQVDVVDDFVTAAWRKLCINAAGVVNALSLQPSGVVKNADARHLMKMIVNEAALVGRAEGANLAKTIADEVISVYENHPPDSINSLHADRLSGGAMEVDIRNGIITRLGKKHGIPTAYNDMAISLLAIDRPTT